MGGGRRVLTQKEQNAEYLREYSDFIKNIKHLDLEKQEIELREESAKNAEEILCGSGIFEPEKFIKNLDFDNKIVQKLLKIIFESEDVDIMLSLDEYFFRNIRYKIKYEECEFTLEKLENLIKKSSSKSLKYASLIGGRFEKGEKAIASAGETAGGYLPAVEYAKIIKGRFELGEKKIMQKTKWIYEYSKIVGMLPEEMHNMLIASCL